MTGEGISFGAYATAFGAGLISVLSPCVVPLLPGYLSLVSGVSIDELREADDPAALRARIRRGSAGFVAGFSTVFVLLGASATAVGGFLRGFGFEVFGYRVDAIQLAGVVIIAMGLHLLGVLRIPLLYRDTRFQVGGGASRGLLGTFLVGAAFAFGWSPCVGPILGGILTMAGSHETVYQGMGLLAVYAAGLAVPFLLAGLSVEWFFRSLARVRRHLHRIEQASGVLLIALGLLVASNRLTWMNEHLAFLNGWVERAEAWLL
jgi:cytochrome c-type biogenesis protein